MKMCARCKSLNLTVNLDSSFIQVLGRLDTSDERMVKILSERGIPHKAMSVSRVEIFMEDNKPLDDPNLFRDIRCSACGCTEILDKDLCPRCHEEVPEILWCVLEGTIVCNHCRDSYSCNNDCNVYSCKHNPKFGKPEEKPVPKKIKFAEYPADRE